MFALENDSIVLPKAELSSFLSTYLMKAWKAGVAEGIAVGIAEGGGSVDEMTMFVKPKRVAYSAMFGNQAELYIQMLKEIA